MRKTLTNKNGIRLLTEGTRCDENIDVVLSGAANIVPANIVAGVTFVGVTGTAPTYITVETEEDLPETADDGVIAVVGG